MDEEYIKKLNLLQKLSWITQHALAIRFREVQAEHALSLLNKRIHRHSLHPEYKRLCHLWWVYNSDLDAYVEKMLAPQGLDICVRMQKKLPRELRDIILEYTLEIRKSRDQSKTPNPSAKPYLKACRVFERKLSNAGLLHICNIEFVGLDTLCEIAQTWYRTATFPFDTLVRKSAVSCSVFRKDLWGFGPNVANRIQNVKLHVEAYLLSNFHDPFDADLRVLLRVTKPTKILVCVNHEDSTRLLSERLVAIALKDTLVPHVDKLVNQGHAARLWYGSKKDVLLSKLFAPNYVIVQEMQDVP
ncbi:hypothetical protein BDW02DRAFT_625536 [Decorospora gaudefroyi]|uniref:Uncharacterized protein n=1 Tax=Decorospora gaudefroyi TaxID=184978 RepID=A0A6A5KDK3_9PLEO|nr:hypothetical protein BDW02DRAFT_605996 [Decorospora gaudefroyi]KAF1832514.1 hypothetical protein BDW02DRAFT_625536 [Decorospora gaudefroyi]